MNPNLMNQTQSTTPAPAPYTLDDIRRVVREEAMAAMKTLLAELQRK